MRPWRSLDCRVRLNQDDYSVACQYFYDIPVYRLAEKRYYQEMHAYLDHAVSGGSASSNSALRDHLERTYGGCWRFNEVVGYIRLFFLGSQVRGEYMAVGKKRIVRTRKKVFECITLKRAPEADLPYPYTNPGIYDAILGYLDDCRKELPGRYVDTALFEAIGRHVDWIGLMRGECGAVDGEK